MEYMNTTKIFTLLVTTCLLSGGNAIAQDTDRPAPITIREQGSFMVGGTTVAVPGTFEFSDYRNPAGQNAYADHAYVFYQIPVDVKKLPLVFLHGGGQSGKTWETTPDGREGFQTLFLRRGYGCYTVDQPRRGRAGSSSLPSSISPICTDKMLFSLFRFGRYPEYYPGTMFPQDSLSLRQLQRWGTPDTGPYDDYVTSDAMAALFDKIGGAVLVSHSRGGHPGWLTTLKSDNVKGIISLEPGGWKYVFPFPENELPEPVRSSYGLHQGEPVPLNEFMKLTRIPILIIYGDFIAEKPVEDIGQDQWRVEMQMARAFADAVNRHGGNAKVIHLPEIGIKGNTHFMMSDLNNVEIADVMEKWMEENKLNND